MSWFNNDAFEPCNVAILKIKGSNYHCIISLIGKNEAINLMQNADLTGKKWNIIKHKNLLSHIKNRKETFGDIEIEKKKKVYHNETPIVLKVCRYWESISI